jgi:hypothetical protein
MSRTRHHRDALSPRRYIMKNWPPWRRFLHALWHLRDSFADLVLR